MGGGKDLVARRAGPRDAERAFVMIEAVVEAGFARHGALRYHATVRRRNENEAEDGGRSRDSRRNAGEPGKRFLAERAEDRTFGRGAGRGVRAAGGPAAMVVARLVGVIFLQALRQVEAQGLTEVARRVAGGDQLIGEE